MLVHWYPSDVSWVLMVSISVVELPFGFPSTTSTELDRAAFASHHAAVEASACGFGLLGCVAPPQAPATSRVRARQDGGRSAAGRSWRESFAFRDMRSSGPRSSIMRADRRRARPPHVSGAFTAERAARSSPRGERRARFAPRGGTERATCAEVSARGAESSRGARRPRGRCLCPRCRRRCRATASPPAASSCRRSGKSFPPRRSPRRRSGRGPTRR